jgi:hypothetical protein
VATLKYYRRTITDEGDIIEMRTWNIDKSKYFPHGIKYSLVYIHNGKRILGYDNERNKGDHKHYFEKEEKYEFISINKLSEDFTKDVENLRRDLYGNKEN